MKKIYILLTATAFTLAAQAQQLNLQSRVYFARLTANPALTAYNGSTNVYGFFRDQWSGALSHPRMAGGIGEISLWNDRLGTGVEVMSYTGGVSQIIEAKLYGAVKIKLAQDHRLSLGVTAGIIQHGTNASQADREMSGNDPMLDKPKATAFDMNIGLAYQWKKLTIGFAIPNLLDANTRVYGNRVQITNFKRNYLINGSYEISLAKDKFHLEPGFVMKIDQLKNVNLNLQLMADYNRFIFLGVGYDLMGGLPVTAGVKISKIFTLAYTYQVPLLQGMPFTPSIYSSHELTVGICFDKWMKKADKAIDAVAAAPQQTAYDSLLSRKASADSLTATQKAVDSLAQKVDALQQALANAQKEQPEKPNALNKQAEDKKQQDAAKAKEKQEAEAKAQQEIAAKEKAKQEAEAKAKAEQEAAAAKAKQKQEAETKAQQAVSKQNAEIVAPVKEQPLNATDNSSEFKIGTPQVLEQVSFDMGTSTLSPNSYSELNKLAAFLQANSSLRVRIIGHTSDQTVNEYNGLLSQQRARVVLEYLHTKGIAPDRIRAQGMGPRVPIAGNDTEEGRAKNRRVEVEIIK